MTEPFGEHTCACGQPADRHRFIGGWMCGTCAKKQNHPWMQENPMTPPDRPAQPAPDLDAPINERYLDNIQKWLREKNLNGTNEAADAITSLRAQLAERDKHVSALEAALMAIRGKASELVEFYASGVSKEIANLATAALNGGTK